MSSTTSGFNEVEGVVIVSILTCTGGCGDGCLATEVVVKEFEVSGAKETLVSASLDNLLFFNTGTVSSCWTLLVCSSTSALPLSWPGTCFSTFEFWSWSWSFSATFSFSFAFAFASTSTSSSSCSSNSSTRDSSKSFLQPLLELFIFKWIWFFNSVKSSNSTQNLPCSSTGNFCNKQSQVSWSRLIFSSNLTT